ncbi:MAG: Gfo/Idh/MocA family oxidoreductase [Treponemataceae bacterium]
MATHKTFRVGVIGCGFFAPNQIQAWRVIDGAKIGAICDQDETRTRSVCERLGLAVPVFADAEEMMASGLVDFVDIVTQPDMHHPLVMLAAREGMPAIVQKPMALEFAAANEMVAAMSQAKLPFMVHENFRFQAPIATVGELVLSGRIGRPTHARISFRTGWDIYAGQPYLATEKRFVLADLGVHVLDVARFLLGEVARLTCEAQSLKPCIAGEDTATMLVRHLSGATSVVECSYASPSPDDVFPQVLITVEGTVGAVVLGPGYQISILDGDGTRRWSAEPPLLPWASAPWQVVQDSVLRLQASWIESLKTGAEPVTSGRDNLKTLQLVEAAYASIAAHGTVTI